jgi:hypothetical protein
MSATKRALENQPNEQDMLRELLQMSQELRRHAELVEERAQEIKVVADDVANHAGRLLERMGLDPYEVTEF